MAAWRLGSALLTRATARHHKVGLDSYDRLFPGQDTLPTGGFGNLMALPLQGQPRGEGRNVFVDGDLRPAPDQWRLLSGVKRLSRPEVEGVPVLARMHRKRLAGYRAMGYVVRRRAIRRREADRLIHSGTPP